MEAIVRMKRELAYQGTVLKIYRDTVIANGIEEVFDYIHHNGAAAVLPVTADGKIMLFASIEMRSIVLHWSFRQESWISRMNRVSSVRIANWKRRQDIVRINWSI